MNWNWLRTLLKLQWKVVRRHRNRGPQLEELEARLAPVIGGTAAPAPIPPGGLSNLGTVNLSLDGVVRIGSEGGEGGNPNNGTGALMSDGLHILTAAHIFDRSGFKQVTFDLAASATGRAAASISVAVPKPTRAIHPDYVPMSDGKKGNDIAVLDLTDQATGGMLVAPYYSPQIGYPIVADGFNPINQQFTIVGYGMTGIGATGREVGTQGTKRMGANAWDATGQLLNNEVQTIGLTGIPNDGYFRLSLTTATGEITTTDNIEWRANSADVLAALNAATTPSGLTPLKGNVIVTGGPLWPGAALNPVYGNKAILSAPGETITWFISFKGDLANTDVSQLSIASAPGANALQSIPGRTVGVTQSTRHQGGESSYPGSTLLYDFDNGSAQNDTLGLAYNIQNLGIPSESSASEVDSGGPLFVDGQIAGVVSGGDGKFGQVPDVDNLDNDSFGTVGVDTNVGSFVNSFITPTLNRNPSYDLVLDMNKQELGVDGVNEDITITVQKSGGNLVIQVNDSDSPQYSGTYFTGLAANIKILTIRGGPDNETIKVIGDLGITGSITLNGGGGDNTIMVGADTAGNVDDIPSSVVVDGGTGGGTNALIINDVAATALHQFFLREEGKIDVVAPQLGYAKTIAFDHISNLVLNTTGTGSSIVMVNATKGGTTTSINSGSGDNDVVIGFANDDGVITLDGIQGRMDVTAKNANLTVDDRSAGGQFYTVTNSSVIRGANPPINYSGINNLYVYGGDSGQYLIKSTCETTKTFVEGYTGNDTFMVGSAVDETSTMDGLKGELTIDGGLGDNTMILNNRGSEIQRTYVVTDSTVDISGLARINYYNIAHFKLIPNDSGSDSLSIQSGDVEIVAPSSLENVLVDGGQLQFADLSVTGAYVQNGGTTTITEGGTLDVIDSVVINSGFFYMTDGNIVSPMVWLGGTGQFQGNGTIVGDVGTTGIWDGDNGTLTIYGSLTVLGGVVSSFSHLSVSGELTVAGGLLISSNSIIDANTFIVEAGATFTGSGIVTAVIDTAGSWLGNGASLAVNGSLSVTGGLANIWGALSINGDFEMDGVRQLAPATLPSPTASPGKAGHSRAPAN